MDLEAVADPMSHTGECPTWHPEQGVLYWIDIPTGTLYRHRPAEGGYEVCHEVDALRAVTVEEDGSLLLFHETGAVERWDEGPIESTRVEPPGLDEFRFNDVTAGPGGRVYCGIMPEEDRSGALYRLDRDGRMTELVAEAEFPNGMDFSPAEDRFYFTDSFANVIYAFDFDAGAISNRRPFATTDDDPGVPDGLAVDETGDVWSARFDGGEVVRYTADGDRAGALDVRARKVTSVGFGGEDLATAYLTTALAGSSDPPGPRDEEGEWAGALLAGDLGVAGKPAYRSAVSL